MHRLWIIGIIIIGTQGIGYTQFLTRTSLPVKKQNIEKKSKNGRYTLGAGFYTQFININLISFGIDSSHIFSDIRNPYHHAIIKFGMGIGLNPDQNNKTFISPEVTASIGYMWIVGQVYSLKRLGIGITADTGIIISDAGNHYATGLSIQLVLNNVITSIGTGININTKHAYGKISLGILM